MSYVRDTNSYVRDNKSFVVVRYPFYTTTLCRRLKNPFVVRKKRYIRFENQSSNDIGDGGKGGGNLS